MKFDTQDILRLLSSNPGRRHQVDDLAIDLAYKYQITQPELGTFKSMINFHLLDFMDKGLVDYGSDGYSMIDPFEEEADHG